MCAYAFALLAPAEDESQQIVRCNLPPCLFFTVVRADCRLLSQIQTTRWSAARAMPLSAAPPHSAPAPTPGPGSPIRAASAVPVRHSPSKYACR